MSEATAPKKTKLIYGSIVAVVLVIGFFIWRSKRGPDISYREIPLERGDLSITILSTGTVQPENRLEIKPPVAGRVEQVLVDEGQKVKKGQILAWMSSTERAALLDAARSEGPAEVKKWEELYKPTPVISPLAGTIILRNVESGQTFTSSDSILSMSDRLTVKAQVDETDVAKVKLKQRAEIILDAYPNEKIPATVDQIAFDAKTVNNVTTYLVDVLPDKTPEFMRSGMTANVTFFVDKKENVLLVPATAVNIKDGSSTVLVKTPSGRPQTREVKMGASDGKNIEIVDGLDDKDVVMAVKIKLGGKVSSGSPFSPMGNRPSSSRPSGGGGHP